jgi:hypothetical protein
MQHSAMGFDPRRWQPASGSRPITANVEALLADNDALRREVRALRLQLELVLHGDRAVAAEAERESASRRGPAVAAEPQSAAGRRPPVTTATSLGITPERVERWGQAMARHRRWQELRIGPPGGLRELIEVQRQRWWNPALELEQELDRRAPGLGAALAEALRGPHSRGRWAVRAAFAVYGPRAQEWLEEAPLRVVEELLRRVERLECWRPAGRKQRSRGTRTENVSGAAERADPESSEPRAGALQLLGLERGASPQAIRRAYRRLAKQHHPDLGGDVDLFHRLAAAYRLLIA